MLNRRMWDHRLNSLAQRSISRPRQTLFLAGLLVALALPGLLRLELRTDGRALVPSDDPVIRVDAEIREHFGLRDPAIVHLQSEHEDGIFNLATLTQVRDLTAEFAALPCIGDEHVISLATEKSDRFKADALEQRWLIEPLPKTPAEMEDLRSAIDANSLLVGTLVSEDRRSTAILVGLPNRDEPVARECQDRVAVYRTLENVVASIDGEDSIAIVGAPIAESLLGIHILEDLAVLVPLAMTLIGVVLWLGCRRLWGVLLGMGEVGAAIVFTFGVMGWLGFPVYLTTAVLPVILTAIGLADEIHVFWRYQQVLNESTDASAESKVRRTMRDMSRPVIFTSLTSTIGFLSFLSSPIAPIRSFGLFAAVGILFCMVWSLTAIPAALRLLPESALRRPPRSRPTRVDTLPPFVRFALARRGLTLAVLMLVTLGLGSGMARLHVQDGWLDGFAVRSEFRQASEHANQQLFGTHVLLAHLSVDSPEGAPVPDIGVASGPLLEPDAVRAIGGFEDFLRTRSEVGGVLGLESHVVVGRFLKSLRLEMMRKVPDRSQELWVVLAHLEDVRGTKRQTEMINAAFDRTIVTIFLKDANFQQTGELMQAIRAYEREHLAAHHLRLDFAGDVAVSQAMIPAIVDSQVTSLLLALGGAFLTLCVLYGSPRRALLGVAPACFAVAWVFGAMGWLGIPLGVATSMFCAITLGIGVDHGIHFLERYEKSRRNGERSPAVGAIAGVGPAIVTDTLAVALGFGLLLVSQIPANARLGVLVAFALIASCLWTLLGLGSWLTRPRQRATAPRPMPVPVTDSVSMRSLHGGSDLRGVSEDFSRSI